MHPCRSQSSASDDHVKDHCNLDVLNSATLVENTRLRFQNDEIYTCARATLTATSGDGGTHAGAARRWRLTHSASNSAHHTFALKHPSVQSLLRSATAGWHGQQH